MRLIGIRKCNLNIPSFCKKTETGAPKTIVTGYAYAKVSREKATANFTSSNPKFGISEAKPMRIPPKLTTGIKDTGLTKVAATFLLR